MKTIKLCLLLMVALNFSMNELIAQTIQKGNLNTQIFTIKNLYLFEMSNLDLTVKDRLTSSSRFWDKQTFQISGSSSLAAASLNILPYSTTMKSKPCVKTNSIEYLKMTAGNLTEKNLTENYKKIYNVLVPQPTSDSIFNNELIYFAGAVVLAATAYLLIQDSSEPISTQKSFGFPPNPDN